MENKEPIVNDNVYTKPKKKTKDELYTQLFSLLDERIQNMTDKEYQEYKRIYNYHNIYMSTNDIY